MSGRERLSRTFGRQCVDRIPVAPFLYYNSVYEMFGYSPRLYDFYDPPDFDPIEKFVEYCDYFGFDVLHTLGSVWDVYAHSTLADRSILESAEGWEAAWTDEGPLDEKRRVISINTPGGTLRQVESYRRGSRYLVVQSIDEPLIKGPRDFELLRRYAPPPDNMDCSLISRAREAVRDRGLVNTCVLGVFNLLTEFRHAEKAYLDPLLDEVFFREMMEFFLAQQLRRVKTMAQAGAEVFEVAMNMATSKVGEQFYRKYLLEYEKRLLGAIRDTGAFITLHNCGDAAAIMHLYNEMDIDCWGYLTPRPFGDVDLADALRAMRPDLVLKGNIDQVEFMLTATPDQVRERVRNLLGTVKARGNFILSTTDFFFDGTPYGNIEALAQACAEYGRYE